MSTTEATFEVGIGTEALQAIQVIQVPEAVKPLVHVAPLGPSDPNNYTRTWKYPNGRKTRSTLALIICDLPAARQALGFTGPQSTNFCSYCKLQLKDINNLNVGSWEPHSCEKHLNLALEWRDTSQEAQRVEITRKYGIHYSEFLQLPYFDPIHNLCVDPMHTNPSCSCTITIPFAFKGSQRGPPLNLRPHVPTCSCFSS